MARCHSASLVSMPVLRAMMPAALTTAFRRPVRATVSATTRLQNSGSLTSPTTAVAPMAWAVWLASAALASTTTTSAPASANSRAICAPMPLAPPVTRAVKSLKSNLTLFMSLIGRRILDGYRLATASYDPGPFPVPHPTSPCTSG